MILIIKIVMVSVAICLGLKVAMQQDMILEGFDRWLTDKVEKGSKICKPLGYCIWCMPSIYCMVAIFFCLVAGLVELKWNLIILYPIFVMATSFIAGVLWHLWIYLTMVIKRGEQQEQILHFEIWCHRHHGHIKLAEYLPVKQLLLSKR